MSAYRWIAVGLLFWCSFYVNASSASPEIQRIERQLQTLERYVYGSQYQGHTGQQPAGNEFNDVYQRLQTLEVELQKLTGTVERLSFQLQQQRQSSPYLSQSLGGDSEEIQATAPLTLSPNDAQDEAENNSENTSGTPMSKMKAEGIKDQILHQYNQALILLKQGKIMLARNSLNAFIEQHGDHRLSSNAYYWLGETYFAEEQFQQAAVQFMDGYNKDPAGPKSQDNLLKLGVSLANIRKTTEACATFSKLLENNASLRKDIREKAEKLMISTGC